MQHFSPIASVWSGDFRQNYHCEGLLERLMCPFVFFLCCTGCTRSAWARWTSSCRKWWQDVPRNTWSLWPTCRKTCRSGPKLPVAEPTEPLLTFPSDLDGHMSSSVLMIIPACHRDLQGAVLGVGEEQVWVWDPGCLPTLGGKRR